MSDKIERRSLSEKDALRCSIAITFSPSVDHGQKLWSFCNFSPFGKEDLYRATEWLESYAMRYSEGYNPVILSDFDEYYQNTLQ
jgi:hypothetical protein